MSLPGGRDAPFPFALMPGTGLRFIQKLLGDDMTGISMDWKTLETAFVSAPPPKVTGSNRNTVGMIPRHMSGSRN
jgi:hypothetical protein